MLTPLEEVQRLLQARDRELTALQAVSLACSEEPDEDALIRRVTGIICETLQTSNFGIATFDEQTGLLTDHASARRGALALNLPLRLGQGVLGTVALTRRPMRVGDVRREPAYLEGDPATRSELAVPILVHDQLIGVINSESTRLDAFSEADERLLTILAGQLAPAVARLRALTAIRDREEKRRRMEQECAASEERYRSLFNEVPVGLYQTTPDGRHLAGNRAYLEMIGVPDLAALERWDVANGYAHPEDRAAWCREMEARGYIRREAEWHCPDGRVIWVDERARYCRDAQGEVHYDGSVVDITERKLAELAGESLRDRLRQAEKLEAVGQLAGGVAHDFNNQLCAIMAFAESLEELAEGDTQRRFAQNILRSCQRSADLIRKLLAFARKGSVLSEPVDLHQVIQEVVSLLEHTLDKRIILRTRLAADQWVVEGDPNQLENALMNLALNARDAMPDGGVLAFETRVRTLDGAICRAMPYEIVPGTYLEITLTDTGTGMDAETLRHIFEPFFTTKGLGHGTGLGLASVYGTVNQHQGYIQVYSTPRQGASFKLYLPLSRTPLAPPAPAPRAELQAGSGHILFVDDEPFVVEGASSFLTSLNYQVTVFDDGADCLAFYEKAWEGVDLVILDMVMPGLGGKDSFQALRRINPQVKVLLISGFSVEDEARQLLKAGAVGYLQKPFRRYELANAVAKAMQGAMQGAE